MAGAELLLHFNFAHLPFMANTGLSMNHKNKMRCFKIQIRAIPQPTPPGAAITACSFVCKITLQIANVWSLMTVCGVVLCYVGTTCVHFKYLNRWEIKNHICFGGLISPQDMMFSVENQNESQLWCSVALWCTLFSHVRQKHRICLIHL